MHKGPSGLRLKTCHFLVEGLNIEENSTLSIGLMYYAVKTKINHVLIFNIDPVHWRSILCGLNKVISRNVSV